MSSPGRLGLWLAEQSSSKTVAGQSVQSNSKELIVYLAPKGDAEEGLTGEAQAQAELKENLWHKNGGGLWRGPVTDPNRGGSGNGRDDETFTCLPAKDRVSVMCDAQRLQGPVLWARQKAVGNY